MIIKYKLLLNIFLGIILLCGLVFAAHIITTSDGETSYSVNEDTIQLYNISVNNTGALNITNISSVNITIPDSFSFLESSNGTDAGTHVFSNTSTILNWNNDNLIENLTRKYFWFNATASTPGTYNLTINTTNSTSSFVTNISVTINDTTAPNLTITLPTNTTYSGTTVDFELDVSDNVGVSGCLLTVNDGVTNYTMTNTTSINFNYTLTLNDASYNVIYYCNDTANNINGSLNVSFTVYNAPETTDTPSPGDGGSYTPLFWTNTEVITEEQFNQGVTKDLAVKSRIKLKINNIDHYVGIKELTATTAIIETASAPKESTLSIGEEENFEVTGDEYYDLYIKLNSISNNKAEITIKSIHVLITEEEELEAEELAKTKEPEFEDLAEITPVNLTWILITLGIVVALLVSWALYSKKGRNKIEENLVEKANLK